VYAPIFGNTHAGSSLQELLGLGLLCLPMVPDVLVGGQSQKRDVDVEEAQVQQQSRTHGGEQAQNAQEKQEDGLVESKLFFLYFILSSNLLFVPLL